jgi:DNA-binding response OmpR family regulator
MNTERTPNRGRILIIETDDLIRDLIVRWLLDAGHTVATSEPGQAFVELVITDVPNPRSAETTLRELTLRHGAPILAISGRFRRDHAAGTARRLGVRKVLPKPFSREELLAAVEECLDAG